MRTKARRGEGDRLREEILAAAEALLIETGSMELVSIRAIADRVGVTPPSLYRHFPDKDALLYEVTKDVFRRLDEHVAAELEHDEDEPMTALASIAASYVRFGLEHPAHYRIMFLSDCAPPDMTFDLDEPEPGLVTFSALVEATKRCIDKGLLPSEDPQAMAGVLWAAVHGIVSLRIMKGWFPWPPVEEQVRLIVDVVRARGASPID